MMLVRHDFWIVKFTDQDTNDFNDPPCIDILLLSTKYVLEPLRYRRETATGRHGCINEIFKLERQLNCNAMQ